MNTQGILVAQRGDYTLYRGNLGGNDPRSFFARGPVAGGQVATIASFLNETAGLQWLRERDASKESPRMV